MAYEGPQIQVSGLVAGASLTTKQYYFVKLSADNTVVVCSGTTDKPIGVLQNNPASGAEATVCCVGVTKVSSDVALSAGNLLSTSADGQAGINTPGSTTTLYIVGQCIQSSGAGGELATAVVNCAAPHRGA